MTGERLIAGRYRLAGRIGTGAMGVVWRATDTLLGRTVAVKQLLLGPGLTPAAEQEAKRRAIREGRIAARLHHPNAVTVFDVVEDDDQPWLVMEYVDAPSLATVLSDGRALEPAEVARIGAQIADALAAAHDAGIVHRDVKPGNVLLATDGTAKITDFGISRAVGDVTVTATGLMAGTPAYLAPEVARGEEPLPASDVFALGSTLYAAVEGRQLFGDSGNALAVLHTVARGEVEPPRRAGALGPVLLELLTLSPADRLTMRQSKAALEAVADGRSREPAATKTLPRPELAPSPPPPVPPADPDRRRRRALLIGLGVAALLVIGGVVAAVAATTGSDDHPAAASPADTVTGSPASPPSPTPSAAVAPPPATDTTTAAPSTTTPPSSTTTPTTSDDDTGPASMDDITSFVQDYYGQLPEDVSGGWSELSSDYQAQTGGYDAYVQFWSRFKSVEVGAITPRNADTVVATLTYTGNDGSVTSEQRWLRVDTVGGHLLITASGL